MGDFKNDVKYYHWVSAIIMLAFVICVTVIIALNLNSVTSFLNMHISIKKLFVIQLFFWSALGATVACYRFMKQDKEINERESLRSHPDPQILRYPNIFDVQLYVKRIVFSGVLGVIASLILFAGLGYFDVPSDKLGEKHRLFFIIFCFLVGLYQDDFLQFLSTLNKRLLQRMSDERLKAQSQKPEDDQKTE